MVVTTTGFLFDKFHESWYHVFMTEHEVVRRKDVVMIVTRQAGESATATRTVSWKDWVDVYAPKLNKSCTRQHVDGKLIYTER